MQQLSPALTAALIDIDARVTPRVIVDLYEFYESSYVPGVDGFDSADAIETFAAEEITYNGVAYRREVISRGDILKNFGEKTNSVTINFSNISRYLATWAQSQRIEGLYFVIRCVVPSVTDDDVVEFVGRADKPGDIDKKEFSFSGRQDFGNINQGVPPRLFTADDPEGRTPSDPLYEGFRIVALNGSFSIPVTTASTSFFGRLFGRKKTANETRQWSSLDATPYGSVLPMVFGRCQMEGIPIQFADIGYSLIGVWAIAEGRIDTFTNVTVRDDRFELATVEYHYGDPGGTGSNATNSSGPINQGYLSKTAYAVISIRGSAGDVVDESPIITQLVRGTRVPVPSSLGVFDSEAWSDNPVDIARFILTDPRLVGVNPGFMEDAVNYLTHLHCDEPLLDESNGEVTLLPAADIAQGGTGIRRFRSTGIISPRYFLYNAFGDASIIPDFLDADYLSFDLDDIPTTFDIEPLLRKRYTISVPITERIRAVDFLYKVIFPAGKMFLRINKRGKYEIRSEQPSDATMLRSATAVGASALPILDVTPWKMGPDLLTQRLLLGFGLTTSEIRNVLSADYSTSGNAITLGTVVTGGVTSTISGAMLSGGSTSVQASGTVTIGGTPAAGNTVKVTIDGIESLHTLNADDTTGTVAAMLAARINANPRLHRYISATWLPASPTIVTIKAKHGVLNLDSQLLKTHTGPIVDPVTAPVLTPSSGVLLAGTYKLAYSDVTAIGKTALSPIASVVLTDNQKIDVGAIALVGVSRNWYMSDAANSSHLKFVANTNGAGFSINALPLPGAALPPGYNTTGEELIRIAMSFATNSQDVFPAWSASKSVISGDTHLPTVPNSHKYSPSTGITGTTEPVWPTSAGGTVVDGGVTWTEIGSTVLAQAGLTRANIKKDTYKWPLNRQSSVNQIKIAYRDSSNDFALTPYRVNDRAHQLQVGKAYPLEVDGSAIDNFNQMFRIANWQLAKNREGDWFNSLETGPQGLVLEEGDVICASDDSGGLVNVVTRIEELRITPNHDVSILARRYSTLMFSDEVGADTIPVPTTLRYTQTVNSIIEFIDNFPIRDADALIPAFYVAVSRDLATLGDWRGWVLYADYGDGYIEIARGDIPAIMGTADTTLLTVVDPSVFDRVNELTFTLKYGPPAPFPNPFSTVTETELIANPRRNLFIVGNEYIQAATVVDNGNQSYTISTFLRGRFGTNIAEYLTHSANERVVYLDGSETLVPIDPVRISTAYNYKAVTTNQNIADATPVSFTWTGGTVKTLAPDALRGQHDSDNNLLATWNRRTRIGGSMRPFSDVPLGEETEEYVFQVPEATPVREWRVITGMALAALLQGSDNTNYYADIDVNTLFLQGPGDTRARSVQQIPQTGNYVEATLICQGLGYAGFGLIGLDLGEWAVGPDVRAQAAYYVELSSPGIGGHYLKFYVNGVEVYSEDATAYVSTGIRIRLTLSGSEVRFTKDWTGTGTPSQYVSAVQPSFPLKVIAQVIEITGGVFVKAEKIVMTINPQPATIYTAAQMTEDFGLPQSTVRVKVAQISSVTGHGAWVEGVI